MMNWSFDMAERVLFLRGSEVFRSCFVRVSLYQFPSCFRIWLIHTSLLNETNWYSLFGIRTVKTSFTNQLLFLDSTFSIDDNGSSSTSLLNLNLGEVKINLSVVRYISPPAPKLFLKRLTAPLTKIFQFHWKRCLLLSHLHCSFLIEIIDLSKDWQTPWKSRRIDLKAGSIQQSYLLRTGLLGEWRI